MFLTIRISIVLWITVIVIAGSLGYSPAFGEEYDLKKMSIEDLMSIQVQTVYGASRCIQKIADAPSSVSIVTADDIRNYGYRTLSDILRSLRSFYVTYDRNYSYIGVRGYGRTGDYNSRVLVLIDGHRLNDTVYDSIGPGSDFILDIDLIDRIEVIRGPGSSLYGSNALFATINIITRRAGEKSKGEIAMAAERFNTASGRITGGIRADFGMDAILSASAYRSKGPRALYYPEFVNPPESDGYSRDADRDRNYSYFSKLSLSGFTLSAAYISRIKGIPTGSYDSDFGGQGNRTRDIRGYLDLGYEKTFDDDWAVQGRVFYDMYNSSGEYLYAGSLNRDFARGSWWGTTAQVTKRMPGLLTVIFGGEFQNNLQQDQMNYNSDPLKVNLDDRRSSYRWSAYLQGDVSVVKDTLSLTAGVRYDHYQTFGGNTSPRLAIILKPCSQTSVKLLYGKAFRAPNAYELYYGYEGNGGQKANPFLQPEKMTTYEAVIEHRFGNAVTVSASGFSYRMSNLIVQTTDPSDGRLVFMNRAEARAKGVEFEADISWGNDWKSRLSYVIQKAEDAETGEILVNSPRQLAKANVLIPLIGNSATAGIEAQYMSKRKTLSGAYVSSNTVLNATLLYRNILRNLDISLSLYNLIGEQYADPASTEHRQDAIEQNGRNFRIKLVYVFP